MADVAHVPGRESYLLTVNTWAMTVVLGLLLTELVPVLRSNIRDSLWTADDIAVLSTGCVILFVQMWIIFGVAFLHGQHQLRYRTDLLMIDLVLITFPAFVAVEFVTSASPTRGSGMAFDQASFRLGMCALVVLFIGLLIRDFRVNTELDELLCEAREVGDHDVQWLRPSFFVPFHIVGLLCAVVGSVFPGFAPLGAPVGLALVVIFIALTVILESTPRGNRAHVWISGKVDWFEKLFRWLRSALKLGS